MVEKTLLEYIQPYVQQKTQLYTLTCPQWIVQKKLFLFQKAYVFSLVLVLHSDLIPMEQIVQELETFFTEICLDPKVIKKIRWFVLSPRGGIYLYETIATKEHKKIKTMCNNFIVINTDSLEVSFGPGHKKNKVASQTLFSLIQSSRFFRKEEWTGKMFDFFALCEDTVD